MRMKHGKIEVSVPGFHPILMWRMWKLARFLKNTTDEQALELVISAIESNGWTVTRTRVPS